MPMVDNGNGLVWQDDSASPIFGGLTSTSNKDSSGEFTLPEVKTPTTTLQNLVDSYNTGNNSFLLTNLIRENGGTVYNWVNPPSAKVNKDSDQNQKSIPLTDPNYLNVCLLYNIVEDPKVTAIKQATQDAVSKAAEIGQQSYKDYLSSGKTPEQMLNNVPKLDNSYMQSLQAAAEKDDSLYSIINAANNAVKETYWKNVFQDPKAAPALLDYYKVVAKKGNGVSFGHTEDANAYFDLANACMDPLRDYGGVSNETLNNIDQQATKESQKEFQAQLAAARNRSSGDFFSNTFGSIGDAIGNTVSSVSDFAAKNPALTALAIGAATGGLGLLGEGALGGEAALGAGAEASAGTAAAEAAGAAEAGAADAGLGAAAANTSPLSSLIPSNTALTNAGINTGLQVASGRNVGDALKAGATGLAGGVIGGNVAGTLGGGTAANIIGTGVGTAAIGGDPIKAMEMGGLSAGVDAVASNIDGYKDLSAAQQAGVRAAIATELKTGNVNAALTAGVTAMGSTAIKNEVKAQQADQRVTDAANLANSQTPTAEQQAKDNQSALDSLATDTSQTSKSDSGTPVTDEQLAKMIDPSGDTGTTISASGDLNKGLIASNPSEIGKIEGMQPKDGETGSGIVEDSSDPEATVYRQQITGKKPDGTDYVYTAVYDPETGTVSYETGQVFNPENPTGALTNSSETRPSFDGEESTPDKTNVSDQSPLDTLNPDINLTDNPDAETTGGPSTDTTNPESTGGLDALTPSTSDLTGGLTDSTKLGGEYEVDTTNPTDNTGGVTTSPEDVGGLGGGNDGGTGTDKVVTGLGGGNTDTGGIDTGGDDTHQLPVVTVTRTQDEENPPEPDKTCSEGFHWDEATQMCVADTDKPPESHDCPEGFIYDMASQSCVRIAVDPGPEKPIVDPKPPKPPQPPQPPQPPKPQPQGSASPTITPMDLTPKFFDVKNPFLKIEKSNAQGVKEEALKQIYDSLNGDLQDVFASKGIGTDMTQAAKGGSIHGIHNMLTPEMQEIFASRLPGYASGGTTMTSVMEEMTPKYVKQEAKFFRPNNTNQNPIQLAKLMQLKDAPKLGGLAHGGLPAKYEKAAPKGHNPEFITGLTGYYAGGRGTGQSDDIPAMLHEGDYVADADVVSALGDGSSKAGKDALTHFMSQVPHHPHPGGKPIPAKIADGEFVFPESFVTALGGGDNKRGAKLLDEMRENLREHKRSAPTSKIPPKAKSPLDYLKTAKG
jgi:hypothetical protein